MYNAFGKCRGLYGEDFFTSLIKCRAIGHEGVWIDPTGQFEIVSGINRLALDVGSVIFIGLSDVLAKGGVMTAFIEKSFCVNLADDHLFFKAETFATGNELPPDLCLRMNRVRILLL